jgi:ABC-type multidrug transport system fused ATPase/permease subunit
MSTGLIIAIVVVVLILIALLVMLPRMRAQAQEKKAQKELQSRRERVATENREAASTRATDAEKAEQQAVIAQQEAKAQRAEAEKLEAEAQMHDRGLADDKLVEDHERDRFSGVTGNGRDERVADRGDDRDAAAGDVRPGERPGARQAGDGADTTDRSDYEQGRVDERESERR